MTSPRLISQSLGIVEDEHHTAFANGMQDAKGTQAFLVWYPSNNKAGGPPADAYTNWCYQTGLEVGKCLKKKPRSKS